VIVAFIDEHRDEHGVEPMCQVLDIAPSTYWRHKQLERHPELRSPRAVRHDELTDAIVRIHADNYGVYGYRKIHAALAREGIKVGEDQVRRLMARAGLQGVVRGRAWTITTRSTPGAPRAVDLVERQFRAPAPNRLWVSDFTYVATWTGWTYVAFVIDAFADRIVGWRVKTTKDTGLALDALEQAVHSRLPAEGAGGELIAHADAGSQYLSIAYGEHLAAAQILPSIGSVGDAFDNALAETIIGLFKTEVIKRLGPWRNADAVEYAVLEWVDWFNHRRLLGPLGYIPPAEAEVDHYRANAPADTPAGLTPQALR
jgi:putative transposase